MKKLLLGILFSLISLPSFSKIEISIFEPIRFKYHNTRLLGNEKIVGEGIIQVKTDNKELDYGKKLTFDFPKQGLMTNRKKWIKVERFHIELPEKSMLISQEIEHIKVYAIIDKRDIDKGEEANIIEGRYEGYVPIIVSQYDKLPSNSIMPLPEFPQDRPTVLPSYPDVEDKPTTLPSYPDVEDRPTTLPSYPSTVDRPTVLPI